MVFGVVVAFIGVGSNLKGPKKRCEEAVRRLGDVKEIRVVTRSRWYLTSPVGPVSQPDFINGVVQIETCLDPLDLLRALKKIEDDMGRKENVRWGPRVIDLDLLLYGNEVRDEPSLAIPHPEVANRRFVLAPLCDLVPEMKHPEKLKSFSEMLNALGDGQTVVPLRR